jgi:hypothetical protein
METDQLIFVGFEISGEVRDLFVDCLSRDRIYIEDSAYLETVEIDGREYIGTRAQGGIAVDRLEDMARNVVSLMARVCAGWSLGPDEALIIAFEDSGEEKSGVLSADESEKKDDFDYGMLVD